MDRPASASTRRVAMVTGCGRPNGIGAACALALARAGFSVVVTDIAPSGVPNTSERPEDHDTSWTIATLVRTIESTGVEGLAVVGDVSSQADAERMVREAVDRFGRLDVLVNNAGAPQGRDWADIAEVPLDAWERMIAVNLTGTFLMIRAAVPYMRAGKWGRIVNMSSNAGRHGSPRLAAYAASKAAILGLTRSAAMDVAPQGITVNAVCPGPIETSRAVNSLRRAESAGLGASATRSKLLPVGRYGGDPAEVAAVVAFLASEPASFVTAQSISVDGGSLAM